MVHMWLTRSVALAAMLAATVVALGCFEASSTDVPFDASPPPVDSLRIQPDSVEMAVGDTVLLRGVLWSGGSVLELGVSWTVGDTTVATLGRPGSGFTGLPVETGLDIVVEAGWVGTTTVIADVAPGLPADTAVIIVR